MFAIEIDVGSKLVEVKLAGLMSTGEVTDYISELKRQFIAKHIRGYVMIIDVSGMPIQTQDTVRTMGEHMATMPKASAIAIVTGSSLARMQIKRLFTQPYARIVATVTEARGWVLNGDEPVSD